jgi:hypothetical protein
MRSDARYCDQNCRKAYSRRKKKIKREKQKAISAIMQITRIAKDDTLKRLAEKSIDEISKMCDGTGCHA